MVTHAAARMVLFSDAHADLAPDLVVAPMMDSLDAKLWKLSAFAVRERERANARRADIEAGREARRAASAVERSVHVKQPVPVPYSVRAQVGAWLKRLTEAPRSAARVRPRARG